MRYRLLFLGAALTLLAGCGSPSATSSKPVLVVPTVPQSAPAVSPPTSAVPSASAPSAPSAPVPSQAPAPTAVEYFFPVVGDNSYGHSHHDYPATDVITRCGNRVRTVTSGTILAVVAVDRWKASVNAGATRGGLSVSLLGDDGVRYYGSHLSAVDAKIRVGVRVAAGQTLGRTGDTGDASACHLHFGISPPCAGTGDWWTQRGVLFPWPYLDSWKRGGQKSAVAAVTAWKAEHGCPSGPTVDK